MSWGRVVVEYDSREWHSGKDKLEEDAIRRNDLAYMGAFVITVTTGQLYSRLDMDKVVALLRRWLGIKVKEPRYDYVSRQRKLRWSLLRTRR